MRQQIFSSSGSDKQRIAERFGRSASIYDHHAELQGEIAKNLAESLPDINPENILEIGCGTGALTGHLINQYPTSKLFITDLAAEMVARCDRRYGGDPRLHFAVMDGEWPQAMEGPYDLIASSMVLHWFDNVRQGLARLQRLLSDDGILAYTTIGPDCFPEWRDVLAELGLAKGLRVPENLPDDNRFETKVVTYSSGREFLRFLKRIGASEPRTGYKSLSSKNLTEALWRFDEKYNGRVSWQIAYGILSSHETDIPGA